MSTITVPILWVDKWKEDEDDLYLRHLSSTSFVGNYRLTLRFWEKSSRDQTASWYVDLIGTDPWGALEPIDSGAAHTVEEAKAMAERALLRELLRGERRTNPRTS